jgi:hypothetical protein
MTARAGHCARPAAEPCWHPACDCPVPEREYDPGPVPLAEMDYQPGPQVVRLADVAPERVTWLWDGYLPIGKLVVLDGDPGVGKSMLTVDLAARGFDRLADAGRHRARERRRADLECRRRARRYDQAEARRGGG